MGNVGRAAGRTGQQPSQARNDEPAPRGSLALRRDIPGSAFCGPNWAPCGHSDRCSVAGGAAVIMQRATCRPAAAGRSLLRGPAPVRARGTTDCAARVGRCGAGGHTGDGTGTPDRHQAYSPRTIGRARRRASEPAVSRPGSCAASTRGSAPPWGRPAPMRLEFCHPHAIDGSPYRCHFHHAPTVATDDLRPALAGSPA